MSRESDASIKEARAILRGKVATPDESMGLSKALKATEDFSYAWRILARARDQQIPDAQQRLALAQEQALCTYKDPDLPVDDRLTRALEILQDADDLARTTNQETLGLAGAIYKRKWEVDTQKQTLERSLAYYRRGYEQGPASDQGYTGINAAFVLDLLADHERRAAVEAGATLASAAARSQEARQIREDLVAQLSALTDENWWLFATMAEAYFGLEDYEKAGVWLQEARALPNIEDWQFASTARQLALLARLHEDDTIDFENTPAWDVLKDFLGGDATAVQTVFAGKLGVGLSGGGFRASLFHIGVLARLAELDMLRHVETISCVSGGSIIGAHYYLELRKLLQEKPDSQITHQDYLDLVARVQRDFLAGVQQNVRMRVLASLSANWKMFLSPDYSRTDKVGELYESEIFSRVQDGEGGEDRWINRLLIKPMGEERQRLEGFRPKHQNWRRRNKVPTLILNATTLNTGHNWQFTVSRMGESTASIDPEVDANERLRRMYYDEAPAPHKNVRLGRAVGASSCVPALFEPVVLKDLYRERTVRLVDGGVHDNQGIVGLLEQDCTVLLVSDASGQMGSEAVPSKSELGVLLRSNSILQARIRGSEFDDLKARRRASLLRGMMFIHLKQDLDADPVDWVGTEDPFEGSVDARPAARCGPLTSYGIQKDVQRLLAGIRTDLDSFSDAESYALMTSGYRMTEHSFPRCINGFPTAEANTEWAFLSVEKAMTQQEGSDKLKQLLKVGANIPFKIWMLSKPLKVLGIILGLVAVVGFVWIAVEYPTYALVTITVGMIASLVGITLATAILGQRVVGMFQFKESAKKRSIGLAMGVFGWIVAGIHLLIFDKIYLRWGKVDNIVDP